MSTSFCERGTQSPVLYSTVSPAGLTSAFYRTSVILLEGLGFFISGKRAGKDREDE